MKKITIFLIYFGAINLFFIGRTLAQTNINKQKSTTYHLYFPSLKKYIGKAVYEFLLSDSIRVYKKIRFIQEPPLKLNHATISLNKNLYIDVYVDDYKYLNPFNEDMAWEKELFYKEKIGRLVVYENDKPVYDTEE